jgi:hypothetical protein
MRQCSVWQSIVKKELKPGVDCLHAWSWLRQEGLQQLLFKTLSGWLGFTVHNSSPAHTCRAVALFV